MIETALRRTRAAALVAALLGGSGCFQYVPFEPSAVTPGPEVRVELTRVGFAQLPELSAWSGPDLSGRIAGASVSQLFLNVPVAVRRDGMITQTIEQRVAIPSHEIVRMERRVFSRGRTALMAAGVVTLVSVLATAFGDGEPSTTGPMEHTPEAEAGSGLSLSFPLF